MKHIGIFGMSGFAREVNDIASELGYRTVFICRDQSELNINSTSGDVMLECDIDRYLDMQFTVGIGDNVTRQIIIQRFGDGRDFVNLIHPSATFGNGQRSSLATSRGIIICAGVRFTNNIQVGDFTIVNLNATIGHDVVIEDFANIAPGANISGNVHIGTRCWIGTGSSVNQGRAESKLKIGADTIIGSGTVVVKDCEPNAVYVGIPARRIK